MNERIKELRRQATLVERYTSHDGSVHEGKHVDLEMFAELIVRDCIALANKYAAGGAGSEFDVGYISCADALAEEMKEHFGVK